MSDWFENACCRMSGRPAETASFGQRFTAAGGRWLRMIFMPFAFLIDHFGLWLRLSLLYALVLSLLSWGLGYLYVCAGTAETAGFYCRNSVPVYLLYLFLRVAFLGLFCAKWIEAAAGKEIFSWRQIVLPDVRSWRTAGLLLALAGLMVFPAGSFELLAARVPNPDWRIEIAYFAVVSTGFLVPLLAMRYYSWLAFAALGEALPSFGKTWCRTRCQMFKILTALFVIMLLVIFVFGNYFIAFRYPGEGSLAFFAAVSEYVFNLLSLLFTALFAGHCLVQKQMMFGENEHE